MKIENLTKKTIIAENCRIADTFLKRFLGLMGKKTMTGYDGLLLSPCNSIHMFFMRFPLDLIFIDKNNKVICIYKCIKPWRISRVVRGAMSVIELPAGIVDRSGTVESDELKFT